MSVSEGVYQVQRPQAEHIEEVGKGGKKQPSTACCSLCLTSWQGTKDVRFELFRISISIGQIVDESFDDSTEDHDCDRLCIDLGYRG